MEVQLRMLYCYIPGALGGLWSGYRVKSLESQNRIAVDEMIGPRGLEEEIDKRNNFGFNQAAKPGLVCRLQVA